MKNNHLVFLLFLCLSYSNVFAENKVSKADYIDTVFKMSSAEELCMAFVKEGYVEEKGCVDKLKKADKQCRQKIMAMTPGDTIEGDGNELLGQILLCRVSLLKGLEFPAK